MLPGDSVVKNPLAYKKHRGHDSIPGSERSPGGGIGNPLQYSCLKNSMDRGAWQATVLGITKSRSQLNTCFIWYFFFLAAFTILFVFDFWELDYDLSQWKFLWFISVWASLNIIYLDGHLSPQICVDVCVFDVVVTSSSLFGPASVGKDIHLKVTVRMPAGLDAMPLVHGKAWWCNLHAAVSAEVNISAHCRGVFCGQDHGMWVAVVARAIRLYRGYHC